MRLATEEPIALDLQQSSQEVESESSFDAVKEELGNSVRAFQNISDSIKKVKVVFHDNKCL